MIQGRCGARLSAKPLQHLRVASNVIGQELEGDEPAQASILGLVHHTHSAAAQLLNDAVMRDGLANVGGSAIERES